MNKRQIKINSIIFGFCIILIVICLLGSTMKSNKEGFGPKWIRTKKNKMMRMVRRTTHPYLSDFYKKVSQFRRKWL